MQSESKDRVAIALVVIFLGAIGTLAASIISDATAPSISDILHEVRKVDVFYMAAFSLVLNLFLMAWVYRLRAEAAKRRSHGN